MYVAHITYTMWSFIYNIRTTYKYCIIYYTLRTYWYVGMWVYIYQRPNWNCFLMFLQQLQFILAADILQHLIFDSIFIQSIFFVFGLLEHFVGVWILWLAQDQTEPKKSTSAFNVFCFICWVNWVSLTSWKVPRKNRKEKSTSDSYALLWLYFSFFLWYTDN